MRLPRNVVDRARAEDGVFLVEIMVSCVILAIVLVGLVTALDSASRASGSSKQRATAADVAQGDLDTMRSRAYSSLRKLADVDKTAEVTVEGVKYFITRQTQPASPSEVPAGCSNAVSRDVVRLTTTVRWSGMGGAKPVSLSTLVASPVGASGSVVVKIIRNDGTPLPAVSGTLEGQGSATTDASGCARWDDVPPGDRYDLLMQKAGYVQPDGTPTITESVDVSVEQTVTLQYEYDQAAQVGPRFIYRWPGTSARQWRTDGNPLFVTIAHSRLNGGARVFTLGNPIESLPAPGNYAVGPPSASWATTTPPPNPPLKSDVYMVPNLYPFSTAYSGWPDQCSTAKASSGEYGSLSAPLPRGFFYKPADFKMPGMDLRVRKGTSTTSTALSSPPAGTDTSGPWIRIKSPCGTEWNMKADQAVQLDANRKTIAMLGFPYNASPYKICAYDKQDPTKWERNDQANTTPSANTPPVINLQYDKVNNTSEAQCGNDW